MVLGTSTAWAADGRIQFSGAVLAPTCAASEARIDALLSHQGNEGVVSAQLACPGASARAPTEPTTYSLTVSSLDTKTAGNNRLLTYFVGYLDATHGADAQPTLVTQIFA